jgi:adenosylcobinamide amidohydrolase
LYTVSSGSAYTRVHFDQRMTCLSWAPVNGGHRTGVRDILNCTHARNNHIPLPAFESFLRRNIRNAGCRATRTVVLSTCVPQEYLGSSASTDTTTGLHIQALCTAGLGNAVAPGDHAAYNEELCRQHAVLGTINLIVIINRALTDAALSELSSIVTLAKASVMVELDIRSLSGCLCLATGTDGAVVCALEKHPISLCFAGLHTRLAEAVSVNVRQAFLASLKKRLKLTGTPSDGTVISTARARFLAQR